MKPRRRFSNEFKLDAVLLTLQGDRTVKEVSEEMDIPYALLCKWRTKYKKLGEKAFVGKGNISEDKKDIKALERELRIVRQERDILKKALAIFSTHQNKNTDL